MIHGGEFPLIGNRGTVPVDSRFERPVHGLDKVAPVEARVKSENAAAQEPFENFSIPGADGIALRVGPWNMPKGNDGGVREVVSNQLRDERQMIILHEDNRIIGLGFLDNGQSEAFVNLLIMMPVRGSKDGTDMSQ